MSAMLPVTLTKIFMVFFSLCSLMIGSTLKYIKNSPVPHTYLLILHDNFDFPLDTVYTAFIV
jgi:hypothetical protein